MHRFPNIVSIILGVVLTLLVIGLRESDLSPTVIVMLVIAIVVVVSIFRVKSPWRKLTWDHVAPVLANTNVSVEELGELEAKLQKQRTAGDHSVETMVCLSHVYLALGRPQEAGDFAQQACAAEEAKGLVAYKNLKQRLVVRNNAYIARAEAQALQGHFMQAAQELDQYRKKQAAVDNHLTTYTAFLYLLANDDSLVHAVTDDIKPSSNWKSDVFLRKEHQLLAAYLQQRFLQKDTTSDLNQLWPYFDTWLKNYQKYRAFDAYHARMRDVITDMAHAIPMGWLQFANLRLKMDEVEMMISELVAQEEQGDTSYQAALVLAKAHAHLGHGEQAEILARAAYNQIEAEGWFVRTDLSARLLTMSVHEVVAAALSLQGQFDKAASMIMQIVPQTAWPNEGVRYFGSSALYVKNR